jgi:P27 family predicted phage terminase small subunit
MGSRGPLPQGSINPAPTPSAPLDAPQWLPPRAAAVWREVEPQLRQGGRIRPEHSDLLSQWCSCASELRHLAQVVSTEGPLDANGSPTGAAKLACRLRTTMLNIGKVLALDVASSTRLEQMPPPPGPAAEDPFEVFINSRGDRRPNT